MGRFFSKPKKDPPIKHCGVVQFGVSSTSLNPDSLPGETVTHVSCSSDHCAIVCESGRTFTAGNNDSRQLGLEHNVGDSSTDPAFVAELRSVPVVRAACGLDFTFFLTRAGELFACGANTYGQLGTGSLEPSPVPRKVPGVRDVEKVAAGMFHAVVLTTSGEVLATGLNSFEQLGLGHSEDRTIFERIMFFDEPMVDISCGSLNSAFLSESGDLFMSGVNGSCLAALGTGSNESAETLSIRLVIVPSPVSAVACGNQHVVALTRDGMVWAWGVNDHGQLGIGNKINCFEPQQMVGLTNLSISKVMAGGDHTALITTEGDVLMCGRAMDGELGEENDHPEVMHLLEKCPHLTVDEVTFSNTYTILLVSSKLKVQNLSTRVTNLEMSIRTALECPICCNIMSSPIHMCQVGHNVCETCKAQTTVCCLCREPYVRARNLALESLCSELQLSCIHCSKVMAALTLEEHEDRCQGHGGMLH